MDIKTIICAVFALFFGVMWFNSSNNYSKLKGKYKKQKGNIKSNQALGRNKVDKSKKEIKDEENRRKKELEKKKEDLDKEFNDKKRSSSFWQKQNEENRNYHIKKLNAFKDIHVVLNKKFSDLFEKALGDRNFEQATIYYEVCYALHPEDAANKTRLSQIEKYRMTNRLGMAFVKIIPGEFKMGAKPSERGKSADERWHKVKLTASYYMMETEVTQEMFDAVLHTPKGTIRKQKQLKTNSKHKGSKKPVENVSYDEVKTFITKLNTLGMGDYRLPTEAEWEYAARAGYEKNAYGEFDSPAPTDWFNKNSYGVTHDVGERHPNAYGLYDMLGNVSEWVSDYYGPFERAPLLVNPRGPDEGKSYVYKGGSYNSTDAKARVAKRNSAVSGERKESLGFRLVFIRR